MKVIDVLIQVKFSNAIRQQKKTFELVSSSNAFKQVHRTQSLNAYRNLMRPLVELYANFICLWHVM